METGGSGELTAVQGSEKPRSVPEESLSLSEMVVSSRNPDFTIEECSTSRGVNTGTAECAPHHWLCTCVETEIEMCIAHGEVECYLWGWHIRSILVHFAGSNFA